MGSTANIAPTSCSQCGVATAPENLVSLWGQPVCAACKPAYIRRMQEGSAPAAQVRYRGFWIRVLARTLDSLAMLVVFVPAMVFWMLPLMRQLAANPGQPINPAVLLPFYLRFYGLLFVVWFAYYTYFHGRFGATLGKMAIHARVVNADGSPLTYGKALARCFADMLSAFTLDIGYIIAGFDDQKRALHDRICGTRVIATN